MMSENKENTVVKKAKGMLFNEMHHAAVQIVAAYASSENADPAKIPALYKEMIQAQFEIVAASAKELIEHTHEAHEAR